MENVDPIEFLNKQYETFITTINNSLFGLKTRISTVYVQKAVVAKAVKYFQSMGWVVSIDENALDFHPSAKDIERFNRSEIEPSPYR
jgi:hypothetical protein